MNRPKNLRIALLQTELYWEDSKANVKQVEKWMSRLDQTVDLMVLPEMFNTGFTMNAAKVAQTMDGPAVSRMRSLSAEMGAAICGSLIIAEDGMYFNRFFWAVDGEVEVVYDKRHLFRMAGEHEVFTAGEARPAISLGGWKIMPRVCYDLRFPAWNRSSDIDLQIYIANWPAARVDAWDKLLMARAVENQCYVVGVNRIGQDGKGIDYSGHSVVIDPRGNPITQEKSASPGWIVAEIDMASLQDFRRKFPVHMDADRFRFLESGS